MRILQINTTMNTGSTGRIAEEIGQLLISKGHQSYIAYGRGNRPSESVKIKIGSKLDQVNHLLKTRVFDKHGFGSKGATRNIIKQIKKIKPDLIHLHNLHGYYLNVEVLFNYLAKINKPIVWTLHDCWAFTGHCSYFDRAECYKWQTECDNCPQKKYYPSSIIFDNSKNNFHRKKNIFNKLEKLVIVTPSKWLANHVKNSYLQNYEVKIINNGIDIGVFNVNTINKEILNKYGLLDENYILGVASKWDERKGLKDFKKLRELINKKNKIVLVGLNKRQIRNLDTEIIGIERTENIKELSALYSGAQIYVNPTYVDNFPTTNLEALACGTPVITYNTGGSPESIDENTGFVLNKGDIEGIKTAIDQILEKGKEYYMLKCRERAEKFFDKNKRFQEYIDLYEALLKK